MELYTPLVRLKQAMNGGRLPSMTPLPQRSLRIIDPAFTIDGNGFGGLDADPERGLRCPVRGCGRWFHLLKPHWDKAHKGVGGATKLRSLMGLPPSVSLVSASHAERMREINAQRPNNGASGFARWRAENPGRHTSTPASRNQRRKTMRAGSKSVGFLNLRVRCPKQLSEVLIELETRFGRPPSSRDAVATMGRGFVNAVLNVYGSWDNALSQCGLRRHVQPRRAPDRERVAREMALASLEAWYRVHGSLPSEADAVARNRAPMLVGAWQVMKGLKQENWRDAMEVAASLLDIHGGRYGLPIKQSA